MLEFIPRRYNPGFIIPVDRIAILEPKHLLFVVELYGRSGREPRALPSQIQAVENNLFIANIDFEELAEVVDDDGIF